MKKVILVTGASSGIGLASANALHAAGHVVYGSTRDLKRMKNVAFKPVELDVTDDASVKAAIAMIIKAEGKIDVLMNNAGNGISAPAYTQDVDSAKRQFEVNFFGVLRVSSEVLPGMIENKSGLIINTSSLAGLFGLPYVSMYVASKYAMEGYSQSLRMELRSTGVKVALLNLGDFNTGFTGAREKMPFTLDNATLSKEYDTVLAKIEKDEKAGMSPEVVGAKVVKIVASSNPSHNYLVGAKGQTIAALLKNILPGGLFEKLINDSYGLK
jgi:short-subunit dehydrogenase